MNPFALSYTIRFLLPLVAVLSAVTAQRNFTFTTTAAGTRLDNDSLRQAVTMWTGDDHSHSEILAFLGPISGWDVSNVTSFQALFKGHSSFNEDLSNWDTSSVTDMRDLCNGCTEYNMPGIQFWDLSKVRSTARMLKDAIRYNQNLAGLDVTSLTDMSSMFEVCWTMFFKAGFFFSVLAEVKSIHKSTTHLPIYPFVFPCLLFFLNQKSAEMFQGMGLETWNVTNVQYLSDTFRRATNFQGNISQWETPSLVSTDGMLDSAVLFNVDLSSWDMSRIVSAQNMFLGASNYQQSLCWTTLRQSALVGDMLCDSHGSLDPCCVSVSVIRNACCGGVSGRCPMECNPPSPPTTSSAPTPATTTTTTTPTTTITSSNVTTTVQEPISSNNVHNIANNNSNSTTGSQVGAATGTGSDSTGDNNANINAWNKYVWVRVLVFAGILILLGLIFFNYLTRRSYRNQRQNSPSHNSSDNGLAALDAEKGDAKTKDLEDDEDDHDGHTSVLEGTSVPKVTRIF